MWATGACALALAPVRGRSPPHTSRESSFVFCELLQIMSVLFFHKSSFFLFFIFVYHKEPNKVARWLEELNNEGLSLDERRFMAKSVSSFIENSEFDRDILKQGKLLGVT